MSENGAVTTTMLDDDPSRAIETDGCPLPGVEVRIADDDGNTLPTGDIGRLLARACSNFGGYLKRPHLNATDADGWFDTGDLARVDDKGYIRITGRSKDVIIRGGENIACPEVEGAIYEHDDILEACVFGVPDERLGEILCAAIYLRENSKLSIDELQSFLSTKLAAFKIPVNIKFYENSLPRVGSGKFDKPNLREQFLENI